MATYLVLIYGDAQAWDGWSEEQERINVAAHAAFHAEYGKAIRGAAEVQRSAGVTGIRPDPAGRPTPSEGPLHPMSEALGGYYLLEAADDGEALAMAAHLPEAGDPISDVEVHRLAE
jgi:hypothetical protein